MLLQRIGDAAIVADPAGRVTFLNPAAEALTGWTAGEAAGQPLAAIVRLVKRETREIANVPVEEARRTRVPLDLEGDLLIVIRTGAEHAGASAIPLLTARGGVAGTVLMFRAGPRERDAQKTESRLAAIIRWSEDAIVSKDLDGMIHSWNPGAERLFGWTSEEAVGRSIRLIIPPDRQHEEDEVLRRIRRGEPVEHFETVRVRKDGSPIHISVTTSPVRNLAGQVIGASKIARDITDRKRAEAEQAVWLERERLARVAAEAATRSKDQFLAMLSHELRNPIGTIASALAILDRVGQADGDAAAAARGVVARQLGQLTRLVDDLLDVARVTSGKIRLNRAPIELGGLVERAVQTIVKTERSGNGSEVPVEVCAEPVWIDGDETRIEQIVTNLVQNAFKFTPAGGTIRVTVRRDETAAVLEVADTGQGIPGDLLPHVFDLFTQGPRSLDRSQSGLGLGLTLVQRLAAMHGGEVSAASEGAGKGATFTVRLPWIEAPGLRADGGPRPASPAPRRRILVVEDHADGREMLRLLLTLDGHEVEEAQDGAAGVDKALAGRPDAVIVDIGLPGLDGYEVARRIRASESGRRMTLIALTGYGQPEDRRRVAEAGFDAHLVKPMTPEALRRLIAPRR
jgi:PAS domain S-box-containing protein